MRRLLLMLSCATLLPSLAVAQDTTASVGTAGWRPFVVTPFLGTQLYDKASALEGNTPTAGIDVTYRITPMLGIGVMLGASRPMTDANMFPLVRMQAGDTSLYYRVGQRVSQYTYGVQAVASLPAVSRFTPYADLGVGRFTFNMDPQAVGTTRRYSGPMFSLGAGLSFLVGSRTGFSVDLRDIVLSSFDRSQLDATDPLFRDPNFDPTPPGQPAAKSTVHNLRLSIGVRFVPDAKGGSQ